MNNKEAIDFIQQFLRKMEDRDLEAAEAMMAPDAVITFPGGKTFSSQREMVEASRDRYQWVKKSFDHADSLTFGQTHIVYIMGSLYGQNRHGVSFSDIRYIDRFVLENDLISRQDVWNDLAESGVMDKMD